MLKVGVRLHGHLKAQGTKKFHPVARDTTTTTTASPCPRGFLLSNLECSNLERFPPTFVIYPTNGVGWLTKVEECRAK
jgi:hypothetical protein